MKISKLFHWLYASLMFFPLMVIPIFAIYSQRHTIESNIVEKEVVKEVNFNQTFNNDEQPFLFIGDAYNERLYFNLNTNEFSFVVGDVYLSRAYLISSNFDFDSFWIHISSWDNEGADIVFYPNSRIGFFGSVFTCSSDSENYLVLDSGSNVSGSYSIEFYYNLFNLTKMFGRGNEPTIEQFNSWFPNHYYEYTLGRKELLYTGLYEQFNDTDIGSQFIYQTYNVVDKYFNIKDWMNLGGLYDWFILNIFNSSNSLVLPIIFNLITYWLVISFIWLIFDILMYVPSMIHKMLDKARME